MYAFFWKLLFVGLLLSIGICSPADDDDDFAEGPNRKSSPFHVQQQQQQQSSHPSSQQQQQKQQTQTLQQQQKTQQTQKQSKDFDSRHERALLREQEIQTKEATLKLKEQEIKTQRLSETGMEKFESAIAILDRTHSDDEFNTAIDLLEQAAKKKNPLALAKLGDINFFGLHGVEIDFFSAIKFYKESADLGFPAAQRQYAFMLDTGKGAEENKPLALVYYTFAARSYDVTAAHILGYKYYKAHNVVKSCQQALVNFKIVAEKAVEQFQSRGIELSAEPLEGIVNQRVREPILEENLEMVKLSAAKGNSTLALLLGQIYLAGSGEPQDFALAFDYFGKAAKFGNADANAYLGLMYEHGIFVPKNNATALQYYQKASRLDGNTGMVFLAKAHMYGRLGLKVNHATAFQLLSDASKKSATAENLHLLGQMFLNGWGTNKDIEKAISFIASAAAGGYIESQFQAAKFYEFGYWGTEQCQRALALYQKVAERGDWKLDHFKAIQYYNDGDIDRALVLFEMLSERGYDSSQVNAALIYEMNLQSSQFSNSDLSRQIKSFRYFSFSSESNPSSHVKLGDFFYSGTGGVEIDHARAAAYYRFAADSHNSQACFNMGFMHQYGIGIPQDFPLAKRYYDLALSYNPSAYIPVYLALGSLFGQFACHWGVGWFTGDSVSFFSEQELAQPFSSPKESLGSIFDGAKEGIIEEEEEEEIDEIANVLLTISLGLLVILLLKRRANRQREQPPQGNRDPILPVEQQPQQEQ